MDTNFHNLPEFTVSEISGILKRTVEEKFPYVRVRGEIGGFKRHTSGHLYFSLKDENAVLGAVCWKGTAGKLGFQPEDGLEIIATGKVTTYPGQSKYQIVVERMEPAGAGALMALLEKRKAMLQAEGLFDSARKRPLPYLPRTIGVITSPTGAVIRDILHRISDRFPCHVLVWPVAVQGEGCAPQVAAAIEGFNAFTPKPDLLIVARGGGSMEDLWGFNEEIVVRAAANSKIPLISAVGHETDTTLIDYVSDRRAPTPTAAAEMALPVREELLGFTLDRAQRLFSAISRDLQQKRNLLLATARALLTPRQLLETMTQRLDDRTERLMACLPNILQKKLQALSLASALLRPQPLLRFLENQQDRLNNYARLLDSYHYKRVLERGFALVRNEAGALVTSAKSVKAGTALSVELKDGTVKTKSL